MRDTLHYAGKNYRCEACGDDIPRGELYIKRQFYPPETFGYGFARWKLHRFCHHAITTIEKQRKRILDPSASLKMFRWWFWDQYQVSDLAWDITRDEIDALFAAWKSGSEYHEICK